VNLLERIKRSLNRIVNYAESEKDLAREQVIMRRIGELIQIARKKFPETPPDKTPYGAEIETLLKESENLIKKWGYWEPGQTAQ